MHSMKVDYTDIDVQHAESAFVSWKEMNLRAHRAVAVGDRGSAYCIVETMKVLANLVVRLSVFAGEAGHTAEAVYIVNFGLKMVDGNDKVYHAIRNKAAA